MSIRHANIAAAGKDTVYYMLGLEKMKLEDILSRQSLPKPWAEGDNIPWNEPGFSKRMLKEHLSQKHDAASRRCETIACHVEWLHRELLSEQPSRILDLGCGPGLYSQRLALLGHKCTGIDFSPASIAHAKDQAKTRHLDIQYRHEDIRRAEFPTDCDLAMLIFGELNVFSPTHAQRIVRKAERCLTDTGQLVLEVHRFDAIQKLGQARRSWYSSPSGLWSDSPHICLQENVWDASRGVATTRYFIADAATGQVTAHAASYQAYRDEEYRALLTDCGFGAVMKHSSLTGSEDEGPKELMVLLASK